MRSQEPFSNHWRKLFASAFAQSPEADQGTRHITAEGVRVGPLQKLGDSDDGLAIRPATDIMPGEVVSAWPVQAVPYEQRGAVFGAYAFFVDLTDTGGGGGGPGGEAAPGVRPDISRYGANAGIGLGAGAQVSIVQTPIVPVGAKPNLDVITEARSIRAMAGAGVDLTGTGEYDPPNILAVQGRWLDPPPTIPTLPVDPRDPQPPPPLGDDSNPSASMTVPPPVPFPPPYSKPDTEEESDIKRLKRIAQEMEEVLQNIKIIERILADPHLMQKLSEGSDDWVPDEVDDERGVSSEDYFGPPPKLRLDEKLKALAKIRRTERGLKRLRKYMYGWLFELHHRFQRATDLFGGKYGHAPNVKEPEWLK